MRWSQAHKKAAKAADPVLNDPLEEYCATAPDAGELVKGPVSAGRAALTSRTHTHCVQFGLPRLDQDYN